MRRVFVTLALVGCPAESSKLPRESNTLSSDAELTTIATRLVAAARPCDAAQVSALFDRKAFQDLVGKRAPKQRGDVELAGTSNSMQANKFCAWFDGAIEVRLLRIHQVDGESRALLRKVSDTGFGYFDIRAAPSSTLALDAYSYNNGTWISDDVVDAMLMSDSVDMSDGLTINRVNSLNDAGKYTEALAALDSLPDRLRNTQSMQDLRVAIAGRLSVDAYKQAAEERMRRLPNFKSPPLPAMNQAFMRGDIDEALRQLDVLDSAVGGDPFLDTIRASILAQRNRPGDLEVAARRADRAATAEPKVLMAQLVKVGIALQRSEWATAISTLEAVEKNVGTKLEESQLTALPNSAAFFATPQYRAWRTSH